MQTVSASEDASYELKGRSIVSASADGVLRMYRVRDQKTMELVAQGSLNDNILRVSQSVQDGQKTFHVVPRMGSIVQAKLVPFEYWTVLKKLAKMMSELLPFNFGIPPALATPGISLDSPDAPMLKEANLALQVSQRHLGFSPGVGMLTSARSLRGVAELDERFESLGVLPDEQASRLQKLGAAQGFHTENTFIDARLIAPCFCRLHTDVQEFLARDCGMTLPNLWALLNK